MTRVVFSLFSVVLLVLAMTRWVRRTPSSGPSKHEGSVAAHAAGEPAASGDATGLGQVSGTVRDALTRSPLPGVDVIFSTGDVESTATSGADGRYSVALAAGVYSVRVVGDDVYGLPPGALRIAPHVNVTSYDLRAARLAWIAGRVTTSDGAPIAGAHVTFATELSEGAVARSADLGAQASADTGADGKFRVRACPGAVTLFATRGGDHGEVSLPFVAPAAKLEGVEIVITTGASVAGTVTDPDGVPVEGASVTAVVVGVPGSAMGSRGSAHSDAAGHYKIGPLAAGDVRVEAEDARFAPAAAVAAIGLGAAESRDNVDLILQRAMSVAGRVVDAAGTPVTGARVFAVIRRFRAGTAVVTDANGAFVLTPVPAGDMTLVAEKEGMAGGRAPNVAAGATGVVITMSAFGAIAGTVTEAGSGTPLADFTVRTEPGEATHFLAGDGAYHLDTVEPGSYELIVSAPGHAPFHLRNVQVNPGAIADGSVALGGAATVAGRVTDAATGGPISGARVSGLTGHEGDGVYTDVDGSYALGDIAPGRRSIIVEHSGHVARHESGLELAAGERRTLDFALAPLPHGGNANNPPVDMVGIGAMLAVDQGRLVIRGLVPNAPAELAGILAGDELLSIDGVPRAGRPLDEEIEAIRGLPGTTVQLEIQRANAAPFMLAVVRSNVRFGG